MQKIMKDFKKICSNTSSHANNAIFICRRFFALALVKNVGLLLFHRQIILMFQLSMQLFTVAALHVTPKIHQKQLIHCWKSYLQIRHWSIYGFR